MKSNFVGNTKSLQTLSGIDKLDYYIKVDLDDYSIFYKEYILKDKLVDNDFEKLSLNNEYQFIRYRKSLFWNDRYESFYRIGFKNLNTKDGLYSIHIQVDASFLHLYGFTECRRLITDDINIYGLRILKEQISWLDINCFVHGYDFSQIRGINFSSRSRKEGRILGSTNSKEWITHNKLESFMLGSKKHIQLIIYNKKLEMIANKTFFKEAVIDALFYKKYNEAPNGELWNIEFKFKRQALVGFGIDTLDDVFLNINSLFHKMMNSFIYLDSNYKNKDKYKIPVNKIWNIIKNEYNYNGKDKMELKRVERIKYKHDIKWLKNRLDDHLKENSTHNIDYVLKELKRLYYESNDKNKY